MSNVNVYVGTERFSEFGKKKIAWGILLSFDNGKQTVIRSGEVEEFNEKHEIYTIIQDLGYKMLPKNLQIVKNKKHPLSIMALNQAKSIKLKKGYK